MGKTVERNAEKSVTPEVMRSGKIFDFSVCCMPTALPHRTDDKQVLADRPPSYHMTLSKSDLTIVHTVRKVLSITIFQLVPAIHLHLRKIQIY